MTPDEAYLAVVKRVDPYSPKYARRDVTGDGVDETFCNFFAHDVCTELGAELPCVKANEQVKWLRDVGPTCGWHPCDAVEAKFAADRGILTLATWLNEVAHGHIAVVVPCSGAEVCIAQAGARNYLRGPIAAGFGSYPVRFFTRG